jgi:hypothetical protein
MQLLISEMQKAGHGPESEEAVPQDQRPIVTEAGGRRVEGPSTQRLFVMYIKYSMFMYNTNPLLAAEGINTN